MASDTQHSVQEKGLQALFQLKYAVCCRSPEVTKSKEMRSMTSDTSAIVLHNNSKTSV